MHSDLAQLHRQEKSGVMPSSLDPIAQVTLKHYQAIVAKAHKRCCGIWMARTCRPSQEPATSQKLRATMLQEQLQQMRTPLMRTRRSRSLEIDWQLMTPEQLLLPRTIQQGTQSMPWHPRPPELVAAPTRLDPLSCCLYRYVCGERITRYLAFHCVSRKGFGGVARAKLPPRTCKC